MKQQAIDQLKDAIHLGIRFQGDLIMRQQGWKIWNAKEEVTKWKQVNILQNQIDNQLVV